MLMPSTAPTNDAQGETKEPFTVRVQVLSDIHLECRKEMYEVAVGSPVLALLGDIGYASDCEDGEKLREFIHTQSNAFEHVLLIAGNHEFYGTDYDEGIAWLTRTCEAAPRKNVHFLNRSHVDISGIRFIGCTLWTRIPKKKRLDAIQMMSDFDNISNFEYKNAYEAAKDQGAKLAAINQACLQYGKFFERDAEWLDEALQQAREDTKSGMCTGAIVLTHHAPLVKEAVVCQRSFEMGGHKIGCEGSNLYSSKLGSPDPCVKLWLYGHTHKCYSERDAQSGVLFLSNPVGHDGEKREGNFSSVCVVGVCSSGAVVE